MASPHSSSDFSGTRGTGVQHSIGVIFGLDGFPKTVLPWFPGECMCLRRVLRTLLLAGFMGAMEGLKLRLDVVLDYLVH